MSVSNSYQIDLNLLSVFCLLMRERSVSGAARRAIYALTEPGKNLPNNAIPLVLIIHYYPLPICYP